MVSTFSSNIQLEEPARGDDVGTWDTPVNSNTSVLDSIAGGIVTIPLNNSPVVLAVGQYQAKTIVFSSTLTGSVTITFPTSFRKSYEIANVCTGSSAFTITLQTTVPGANAICPPPGETVDVLNTGGTIAFKNLGRIGSYLDYAGATVPNWVTGCTIPPYLNCNGTVFSSALYPTLAAILGGTTLPDRRGTAGYAANQGTGRLTAASGGLDGDTLFAIKTVDSVTVGTSNLPAYTPTGTVNSGQNFFRGTGVVVTIGASAGGVLDGLQPGTGVLAPLAFAGSPQGGASDPMSAIGTGTVYGISMIRAG